MNNNKKPIWNPTSDVKSNLPDGNSNNTSQYKSYQSSTTITQHQRLNTSTIKHEVKSSISAAINDFKLPDFSTTLQLGQHKSHNYKSEIKQSAVQKSTVPHKTSYSPTYINHKPKFKKTPVGATSNIGMSSNRYEQSPIKSGINNAINYSQYKSYQTGAKDLQTLTPQTSCYTRYKPIQLQNNSTNKPELQKTSNALTNSPYKSEFGSTLPVSIQSNGSIFEFSPKLIESKHIEPNKNGDGDIKKSGPAKYFIFNFKIFKKIGTKIPTSRIGSIADVKALKKMFQILNMKGKTFENLTLKELKLKMVEISMEDFSKNSAIVIVIMSHGDIENKIYAKDDIFHLHSDIIDPISNNKHLSDKPKLFFIEACKGSRDPIKTSKTIIDTNCAGSNTLIFEATFEKYVSYTLRSSGSFFTQSLCQKFEEMGKTKEILEICKAVIKDVQYKSKMKQSPTITYNLTTDFCFGNYF